jgi:micrococcal nuclease
VRAAVLGIVVLAAAVACSSPDGPDDPLGPTDPGTVPPFTVPTTDPGEPGGPAVGIERATVTEVVDGDTLEVRLADGRVERLRLVGINTPEDGECLADEAARRLAVLVGDGRVRLVRDESDRDQYGRLLRHVLAGGRSVGAVLVAEGLAFSRAYPPDTGQQAALDAGQARAQAAAIGLWAPDSCGPSTTAAIAVGRVRTDPPGDESLTPNEEWVEVVNTGGRPVDLTGWGVQDESASHRYGFPEGFRLAPGAGVLLRTGCGADTATELHWCVSGSAVWNNDGDTVLITDPSGNIAAERSV